MGQKHERQKPIINQLFTFIVNLFGANSFPLVI